MAALGQQLLASAPSYNSLGQSAVSGAQDRAQQDRQFWLNYMAEEAQRRKQNQLQQEQIDQQKKAQAKARRDANVRLGVGIGAGAAGGLALSAALAPAAAASTVAPVTAGEAAASLAPAEAGAALSGPATFVGETATSAVNPISGAAIGAGVGGTAANATSPATANIPSIQPPTYKPFANANPLAYAGLGALSAASGVDVLNPAVNAAGFRYNIARQGFNDATNFGFKAADLSRRTAADEASNRYREGSLDVRREGIAASDARAKAGLDARKPLQDAQIAHLGATGEAATTNAETRKKNAGTYKANAGGIDAPPGEMEASMMAVENAPPNQKLAVAKREYRRMKERKFNGIALNHFASQVQNRYGQVITDETSNPDVAP